MRLMPLSSCARSLRRRAWVNRQTLCIAMERHRPTRGANEGGQRGGPTRANVEPTRGGSARGGSARGRSARAIDAAARCSGLPHPLVAPNSGEPPEVRDLLLPCGRGGQYRGGSDPLLAAPDAAGKDDPARSQKPRMIPARSAAPDPCPVGRRVEGPGGLRNCKIAFVWATFRGRTNGI